MPKINERFVVAVPVPAIQLAGKLDLSALNLRDRSHDRREVCILRNMGSRAAAGGLRVGDAVVYRGELKWAQPCPAIDPGAFFLDLRDVLAVWEPGDDEQLGTYGEFTSAGVRAVRARVLAEVGDASV